MERLISTQISIIRFSFDHKAKPQVPHVRRYVIE